MCCLFQISLLEKKAQDNWVSVFLPFSPSLCGRHTELGCASPRADQGPHFAERAGAAERGGRRPETQVWGFPISMSGWLSPQRLIRACCWNSHWSPLFFCIQDWQSLESRGCKRNTGCRNQCWEDLRPRDPPGEVGSTL